MWQRCGGPKRETEGVKRPLIRKSHGIEYEKQRESERGGEKKTERGRRERQHRGREALSIIYPETRFVIHGSLVLHLDSNPQSSAHCTHLHRRCFATTPSVRHLPPTSACTAPSSSASSSSRKLWEKMGWFKFQTPDMNEY